MTQQESARVQVEEVVRRIVAGFSPDRIVVFGSHARGEQTRESDLDLLVVMPVTGSPLRANIDETVLLVVITEQGENRNQCEEQRNLFGFPHGFARRGT